MRATVSSNEEQWDAFVRANGGCFLQSWGWSQFQEAVGRSVFRMRIDAQAAGGAGGDTVGQFLVVYHPLPLGRSYAYVPRGPVVLFGGDRDPRVYAYTCIRALQSAASRRHAVFTRVDLPFRRSGDVVSGSDLDDWGLIKARPVQPEDTMVVDLTQDEEGLLERLHQKTRYNLRLAAKKGVEIRDTDYGNAHAFRHDIDLFWRLLDETAARQKFHTHSRNYYETMLDTLSPKKGNGLGVRLRLAVYRGQAVAAVLLAEFGDTVTYLHGASAAVHREVMAPYLLHWDTMLEAKGRGLRRYDLWGTAPTDDPEHPWAGITRFKKGFGGSLESYLGSWELPVSRFWYSLYRNARRLLR
ncbi:hypothetical protein AMJ57_03105 [Parcubacteria bacterium SG8_24]|nr:MAG: hypothetical protein AMJ57_03105 [Parcubacteria bacterium SG8_24]